MYIMVRLTYLVDSSPVSSQFSMSHIGNARVPGIQCHLIDVTGWKGVEVLGAPKAEAARQLMSFFG